MVPEDRSCLALVAGASRGRMAGQGPLLLLLASMAAGLVALKKRGAHVRPVCAMAILANQWCAVLATAVASSRALELHTIGSHAEWRSAYCATARLRRLLTDKHLRSCGEKRRRFISS